MSCKKLKTLLTLASTEGLELSVADFKKFASKYNEKDLK